MVFVSFRHIMKQCLNKEENETVTICHQLKCLSRTVMMIRFNL